MDRNNTNFSLQLFDFFKKNQQKWGSEYDFLKYYQNIVRIYATQVDIDARGLLIYVATGMGKSILAVAIAIDMMRIGEDAAGRECVILLTKSLQENMRGAIKQYITMRGQAEPTYPIARLTGRDLNEWIDRNFSFVSMNASNMLKQINVATAGRQGKEFDAALEKKFGKILKLGSLDGKLLIVDEAHNLFRAITNGSKNALGVYNMVMSAKDLKVMFLTGTPISNDPFELVPCFNMLGSRSGAVILPENYRDFTTMYVSPRGYIQNKEKFQNRIFGLVSYVDHSSVPGRAFGHTLQTKANFPEELPIKVVRVHMTPQQYTLYQLARDKELEEGVFSRFGQSRPRESPAMIKPKNNASSTYRVKSRQISNWVEGQSPKIDAIMADLTTATGLGLMYSQFIGSGGLGSFIARLIADGWRQWPTAGTGELPAVISDVVDIGDVAYTGAALPSAMEYIDRIEAKLAAAEARTKCGGEHDSIMDFALDRHGGAAPARTFAVISGEVTTDDRAEIQRVYNDANNAHGAVISLLLISATGAEGLDLKNVRRIYILEPYWNWGRIKQIIARGVRNGSHDDLPADERNVQPYLYLAIPPESEQTEGIYAETTDTELYDRAVRGQVMIDSYNQALREVSIECMVNDEKYCRICAPTNQALYTLNAAGDIRAPDPCVAAREEHVRAEEIIYDGTKYYYTADAAALYGYKVYKFDDTIGGYRPIPDDSPVLPQIIEAIENAARPPQG